MQLYYKVKLHINLNTSHFLGMKVEVIICISRGKGAKFKLWISLAPHLYFDISIWFYWCAKYNYVMLMANFSYKKDANQKFNLTLYIPKFSTEVHHDQKSLISVQNSLLQKSGRLHYFIRFSLRINHTYP